MGRWNLTSQLRVWQVRCFSSYKQALRLIFVNFRLFVVAISFIAATNWSESKYETFGLSLDPANNYQTFLGCLIHSMHIEIIAVVQAVVFFTL